ncbi:hypothetical protein DPMN_146492 [Dreissena polymorpha]|uniref:WSC domain-containing protein n=1 Tax=Dreissena polymorpha TaxID=45954 RepID=A0A9D4FAE9_DREPO|nr:hypothetical protein DPMN_146492 [Dreissena polymorpha]
MFVHVIVASCIVTCVLAGCTPNPCLNGGTCVDVPSSEDVRCICAPGWDGPVCSTHFRYLGCYMNQMQRVLPVRYPDSTSNSPLECASRCRSYRFAGVENSNECFCGNVQPVVSKPESECNAVCPGESTKKCGGVWRVSVYSNRAPMYRGCYVDTIPRVLPTQKTPNSPTNTPLECASRCIGFAFSGVEASGECFCGTVLPTVLKPDSECNYACPGNSALKCGGWLRISVYSN